MRSFWSLHGLLQAPPVLLQCDLHGTALEEHTEAAAGSKWSGTDSYKCSSINAYYNFASQSALVQFKVLTVSYNGIHNIGPSYLRADASLWGLFIHQIHPSPSDSAGEACYGSHPLENVICRNPGRELLLLWCLYFATSSPWRSD